MKLKVLAVTVLAAGANAFWRMECHGRTMLARVDPLVNPGEPANHLHAIHGGNGFSPTSTYEDLIKSDCSSCRVPEDKSAYWTPSLHFQDQETGKIELVEQVGGLLAYYFLRGDNITAFPPGFSMIAGTTTRREFKAGDPYKPDPDQSHWHELSEDNQSRLAERAVGFNCLNYGRPAEGSLFRHYFPDKDFMDAHCKHGIRAEIMFPMCWNGKDVRSANNKDHVAYANLVLDGSCPDTHPVRLPGLFFETIWATNAFKERKGRFLWSNGDTTGFGYHGDFIMGWNVNFLQNAVDNCRDPSGRIEDCSVFAPTLVTEEQTRKCIVPAEKMPLAIRLEDATKPIDSLFGNVHVEPDRWSGIHDSVLGYKSGPTASVSGEPQVGQVFKEAPYSVPQPSVSSSAAPAPEPTTPPIVVQVAEATPPQPSSSTTTSTTETPAPNPNIYSTQYVTNGDVVTEILWEHEIAYVTAQRETTVTTTVTVTPGLVRRGHSHGRMHRFH